MRAKCREAVRPGRGGRIYYLVQADVLVIVRILHGRRDLGAILDAQDIDDPATE